MAGRRAGLLHEIVVMSVQTLRASKMRSALTVLRSHPSEGARPPPVSIRWTYVVGVSTPLPALDFAWSSSQGIAPCGLGALSTRSALTLLPSLASQVGPP